MIGVTRLPRPAARTSVRTDDQGNALIWIVVGITDLGLAVAVGVTRRIVTLAPDELRTVPGLLCVHAIPLQLRAASSARIRLPALGHLVPTSMQDAIAGVDLRSEARRGQREGHKERGEEQRFRVDHEMLPECSTKGWTVGPGIGGFGDWGIGGLGDWWIGG